MDYFIESLCAKSKNHDDKKWRERDRDEKNCCFVFFILLLLLLLLIRFPVFLKTKGSCVKLCIRRCVCLSFQFTSQNWYIYISMWNVNVNNSNKRECHQSKIQWFYNRMLLLLLLVLLQRGGILTTFLSIWHNVCIGVSMRRNRIACNVCVYFKTHTYIDAHGYARWIFSIPVRLYKPRTVWDQRSLIACLCNGEHHSCHRGDSMVMSHHSKMCANRPQNPTTTIQSF